MNKTNATLIICFFLSLIGHSTLGQSRGELLSATLLESKTTEEIDQLLSEATGGIPPFFLGFLIPTNFDVDAYKLTYRTLNGQGELTTATGALFMPKNYPCSAALANYMHGTLTSDATIPSSLNGAESAVGWAFATDGYVTVLPDYVGMGDSPGRHPYLHADSEASASIDMMRAARDFCVQKRVSLNGQVFLAGYSQGGHAALATQREIERNHSKEFDLELVIGGAGPYDLFETQRKFLLNSPDYSNPSFLPFIMLGYQEVYGDLYNEISELLIPPFDREVPPLLDGTKTVEEIDSQLPVRWKEIITPSYLDGIENDPYNPLNQALKRNNLYDWKPENDLRLYFCSEDELVATSNTFIAWLNFILRGAGDKVFGASLGPFKHRQCAPLVLITAKIKFNFRRETGCCSLALKHSHESRHGTYDIATDKIMANQIREVVEEKNLPDLKEMLEQYGLSELARILDTKSNFQYPEIEAYPNPTSDEVRIFLKENHQHIHHIRVYHPSGKMVKELNGYPSKGGFPISLKNLPKGLYIIEVRTDKTYQLRVVKE